MRLTFCNHQQNILPSYSISSYQMQQTFPLYNLELRPASLRGPEIAILLAKCWSNYFKNWRIWTRKRQRILHGYWKLQINNFVKFTWCTTWSTNTFSIVGFSEWITESIVGCVVEGSKWFGMSSLFKEEGIKIHMRWTQRWTKQCKIISLPWFSKVIYNNFKIVVCYFFCALS